MISTHFDMWIFCDVSSFESEFASVCVEIDVLHPDGQSGPDPIGSGRAGGRFVGHFTDRRGLKIYNFLKTLRKTSKFPFN